MFGSVCWWCYWGWPKPIKDIYDKAKEDIDAVLDDYFEATGYESWPDDPRDSESALQFGPGHVVWSDENWHLAQSCLRDCELILSNAELTEKDKWLTCYKEMHKPALEIVARSLRELAALPDDLKKEPKDYDGHHPENYPPPVDWVMVRKAGELR